MKLELAKLLGVTGKRSAIKKTATKTNLFRGDDFYADTGLQPCSYKTGRHNPPRKDECNQTGPLGVFLCTRGVGHSGKHHAMGGSECMGEWT